MTVPPIDTSEENLAYINSLKAGEEVVEMGKSCMYGIRGVVYIHAERGDVCVRWKLPTTKYNEGGLMGTSVTWGTRRISDVPVLP
jgi:hypothetical protein